MKYDFVFVIWDVETGGLKADKNPVLEIALEAIDFDLNEIMSYDKILKPYGQDKYEITQGALKANGMSIDLLNEKGEDSHVVVKEVIDFFKKCKRGKQKPVLCGHNIDSFDIPFLDECFRYHKEDLSKYVETNFTIDTMWWSRVRFKESVNFKLGTVCDNLGIELVNAHRAKADTVANKDVVKKFLKSLRSDGTPGEQTQEKRYRETFQF